ncbi:MAG: class I SAM-dependent methyltransferase [Desulfobacteraceae bacterium]|nr:class I SAM-dependent methyltransferase [Desulfobacteraceae bacterium]
MLTINFKNLGIKPGQKILDMGCGEGRHVARACQEKNIFCQGADLSFSDLLKTKKKLKFHEKLDDFKDSSWGLNCTDITRLSFKNKAFDIVICSEVLEHIPDDQKAVKELLRVLKNKGILAISVPRFLPEKICWMLSDEYLDVNQGHIRIYQKKNIIAMVEKCGVRHFKTHYAHSLHSPFWWLKCLIGCNRKNSFIINLYHKLLVWDLMKKPKVTRVIEKLLDPLIGKSLVLYFIKDA